LSHEIFMIKKILIIGSILLNINAFAQTALPAVDSSALQGRWSPDCNAVEGVTFDKKGTALIAVNSNQIYVDGYVKEIGNNTFDLFFLSTKDLGRGGASLDWDSFSKIRPIAKISLIHAAIANFEWNGFFNTNKRKYQWVTDPDFYQKDNGSIFNKCRE